MTYYVHTSGYSWPLEIVKSPKSEWGGVGGGGGGAKKDKIIKYIWLALSV
jgi:hypothetical protein